MASLPVGQPEQLAIDPIPTYGLGLYVAFDLTDQPMYSEEGLGETVAGALKSLCSDHKASEGAARRLEISETWEARNMERGRHWYLPDGKGGWQLAGDDERGGQIGKQDADDLFAINMYGARGDKISAAGARVVPGIEFFGRKTDPIHAASVDEAMKYRHIWANNVDAKTLFTKVWGLFYTDGRVLFRTVTIADAQSWGFGDDGLPAMRQITSAHGKLDHSCPIYANDMGEMGWIRVTTGDYSPNTLKEKFSWIAKKIGADGQGLDSYDSLERTARIGVKSGTRFGASTGSTMPETHVYLRPAEFRGVEDDVRATLTQLFPKGVEVVFAGNTMAYARNASIGDSLEIRHARHGDGQNRRALGTNNIPVQKVLNKDITLFNQIVAASIPRKYGDPERINVEAANQGRPSSERVIPMLSGSQTADPMYIESIPQQNGQLLDFLAILRNELPAEMDGATETMFGLGEHGTLGEAILDHDAALQVFATPYMQAALGMAKSCEQAVKWAALMNGGVIEGNVPGQGRVTVDTSKIRGDIYGYPESASGIPENEVQVQARLLELIEQSPNIPLYASALNYPKNLPALKDLVRLKGLEIPGVDSVIRQMGNIDKLKMQQPMDNPAVVQAQVQLQQEELALQQNPNATPEMQQALEQTKQQVAQTPQKVASLPIAQDASENHQIAAAIDLWWINSSEGQKFMNGSTQDRAGFQNVYLDWQAHDAMAKKLSPPPPPEIKPGLSLAVDKLGPEAQAQVLQQEYGIQVDPTALAQPAPEMQHEVVQEKTGIDAQGIPTKTKISLSPGGKVQ